MRISCVLDMTSDLESCAGFLVGNRWKERVRDGVCQGDDSVGRITMINERV